MKTAYMAEIFESFQGEGIFQGKLEYFLRFSGCNLDCIGCDTLAYRERVEKFGFEGRIYKNPITPEELKTLFNKLFVHSKEVYPLNLTGGEPLNQADFIAEFLELLNYPGLIHLETNGILTKEFSKIRKYIDFVSMDWKLEGTYGFRNFEKCSIENMHKEFLASTKGIKAQVKLIVKDNPVGEFEHAIGTIYKTRRNVSIIIQPFVDENNNMVDNHDMYRQFYRIANRFFPRVWIKPQIHKVLKIK